MQVSLNITSEFYQHLESSASSIGKSINDFITDLVKSGYEEHQAIHDLDDFLEPSIKAAREGIVSNKTFEEATTEALEKAMKRQK